MPALMRCTYCGLLQDEPKGVKECSRCGGELQYENQLPAGKPSYMKVQMELDQISAPAGQNVERYLMLSLTAPVEVPPEEAAPKGKKRPALNFTAVLDISGSMHGEKLTNAKEAIRQATHYLQREDAFSLTTFSLEVQCPFEPEDVNEKTVAAVIKALQGIQSVGSTALCGGLEQGITNALKLPKENNLVLLLSDGQANVGETDLEKIGERALEARHKGLVVSTLGVGDDYNEALMAEVATQGGGRFYHIDHANKIPLFVAGELGEVARLAARETQVTLSLPSGATLIPLSEAYPVEQNGNEARVSIGDIPCETELEIPLRLIMLAQPEGAKLHVEGTLEFKTPAGHDLITPVNGVTVRFTRKDTFKLQNGLVAPVAERVFGFIKSASMIEFNRVMTREPGRVEEERVLIMDRVDHYATLLGKEKKEAEIREMGAVLHNSVVSPAAAKFMVSNAHRQMRGSKDFDKK